MVGIRGTLAALTFFAFGVEAARADDADLVKRGEYLARAGDCVACHTDARRRAVRRRAASMDTPFGPIYTPNITPDKETGIGDWSDDDFYRAMHEGIGKGRVPVPGVPVPLVHQRQPRRRAGHQGLSVLAEAGSRAAQDRPALRFPFNIREALADLAHAVLQARQAGRTGAEDRRPPRARRLSGRGARPLRRMPQPPQRARRLGLERQIRGRRDRGLVRAQHHLGRQAGHRRLERGRDREIPEGRRRAAQRRRARADAGDDRRKPALPERRRPSCDGRLSASRSSRSRPIPMPRAASRATARRAKTSTRAIAPPATASKAKGCRATCPRWLATARCRRGAGGRHPRRARRPAAASRGWRRCRRSAPTSPTPTSPT